MPAPKNNQHAVKDGRVRSQRKQILASPESIRMWEQAAEIEGRSVNDLIVRETDFAASRIIEMHTETPTGAAAPRDEGEGP